MVYDSWCMCVQAVSLATRTPATVLLSPPVTAMKTQHVTNAVLDVLACEVQCLAVNMETVHVGVALCSGMSVTM